MAWHDLLRELLSLIFLNIITNNQNFSDLYQCLGVCTSWRHLAKQLMLHVAPPPWLLLQQKYPSQSISFTSISCRFHDSTSRRYAKREVSFNLVDHMKVLGCCDGWLFVGYDKELRTSTGFLYNPLSGVLLQLPAFPRHLRLDKSGVMKFVMSDHCPTDRDCVICVMFVVNERIVLAFCKPAPGRHDDYSSKGKRCMFSSSSAHWVLLEKELAGEIEDVIFYRGKFYIIDRYGALSVCDYDANTDAFTSEAVIVEWYNVFNQNVATERVSRYRRDFLVKSKSGDLLRIKRIFHDNYVRVTASCQIFKLNMSNIDYYSWSTEISSLGEKEALFLGWEDCISVSVSDYNPTFKPNCVYFFDKYSDDGEVIRYGVYNLKTRNFLSYSDDNGLDRDPERFQCCRLFAPSGLS